MRQEEIQRWLDQLTLLEGLAPDHVAVNLTWAKFSGLPSESILVAPEGPRGRR